MNIVQQLAHAMRRWPRQTKLGLCLIVSAWLAVMPPGMSSYGLIDPALHARIDAELYGQRPDGESLPGHEPHPPHEHPANPGIAVSELTFSNPFNSAFYRRLLSPVEQLALLGHRVELAVIAQRITLAPPDQPPRSTH